MLPHSFSGMSPTEYSFPLAHRLPDFDDVIHTAVSDSISEAAGRGRERGIRPERPSGAIGASRDGMTGSICIRLARPLLQRERYSVILDKEAGAACHPAQNPIARSRLSDML